MKPLAPKAALTALEKTLKKLPLDAWEIYLATSRSLSAEAEEGKIDSFSKSLTSGVGVRVLRKEAPGFAYTSDLSPAALEAVCRHAAEAAAVATPDPALALPSPKALPKKDLSLYDPHLLRVGEKKKLETARTLEAAARRASPKIETVRNASYAEDLQNAFVRNSLGVDYEGRETAVSVSVMAVAGEGDSSEVGYEFQTARFWEDLDAGHVGREAARLALEQLGAATIRGRTGPVIFKNLAACELLETLAPSFCGDEVLKGKSGLAGKEGRRIFSRVLQIVDDGLLKEGMASFPFDDEGYPHRRTVLVKGGVLQGFLYDTATARRAGAKSTGNAVRGSGFQSSPSVGVTNLFIGKGKKSLEALLREAGTGLYITELMGVHNANPITGEFSFGCAGRMIEGGTLAAPFKGVAVSGNLFELFGAVEEVGADLRFADGIGSPSLLVDKVAVSGA